MDIAMTIGKDSKSSRLKTILLQLKSDCGARDVFESDLDTTSKRILSQIDQVCMCVCVCVCVCVCMCVCVYVCVRI
jgi:hypothetical protein